MVKEKLNLVAFWKMLPFLFQKDFWRVKPELRGYFGYEKIIEIQRYLMKHNCKFVHDSYQSMILYKNCFVTTQFQNIAYINDFEEGEVPRGFSFKLHRLGPHGVKNNTFLLNHNKTLRYCFHYLMLYQEVKKEHLRTKAGIKAFLDRENIEDFTTDHYMKWFAKLAFSNYFDIVKNARRKKTKMGCYHCQKIFDSKKVKIHSYATTNWQVPELQMQWTNDVVPTAVCPYCNVDSVISEMVDIPKLKITKNLLEKLNEKMFKEENRYGNKYQSN